MQITGAGISEQNDSEIVYDLIRRDIISGDLGAGSKLKVAHLCDHYAFGAAPVREALARLAGDKLVVQQSQRGFRVREMAPEDVEDLGKVRVLLECECVRDSLKNGSDAWEANLVAAYHKLKLAEKRPRQDNTFDELEARNRAFHDALVAACNSPWMLELRVQIYAHHERYRYLSRRFGSGTRDTPAEHAAIYEAALRRDLKETCIQTTNHIDITTAQAIEAIKRA